jgi:hypothetical protein
MIIAELRRRIPGTFAAAAVAAGLLMATSVGPSFQIAGSHADDEGDDPGSTEDLEDLEDFEPEEIVDLDDPDWEDLTEEETEDPESPGEETQSASTDEVEASEQDDRSETAIRVHTALSGDPDIGPGHEEFGQRVSERARTMHLGSIVSRAARGIEDEPEGSGDDEELELSTASEGSTHPGNNGRGNGRGRR